MKHAAVIFAAAMFATSASALDLSVDANNLTAHAFPPEQLVPPTGLYDGSDLVMVRRAAIGHEGSAAAQVEFAKA